MKKLKQLDDISTQYDAAKKHAVEIAQHVASDCQAYRSFLQENKFDKKITDQNFNEIPISDKNSYFRKYSLAEKLYRNKSLSDYYMLCTSTGSTGEPTIWPRDFENDAKLERIHTDFLDSHFQIREKRTLIVISFGLGPNTAGMLHAKLSWEASQSGKISTVTPGIDPEKTVFLIQSLYKEYDQVISIGYPPFISEFIDLAIEKEMPVREWNLKVVFTSESVSNQWRQEIANKIDKEGKPNSVIAFYACTEAGIIGVETPETNAVINAVAEDDILRESLFKSSSLPTLVEVNFLRKFVEVIDGEVILSVDQPIPLVRYNLHDRGVLLTGKEIKNAVEKVGGIDCNLNVNQMFLAIFGKNDLGQGSLKMEDIRAILTELKLNHLILREFQFSETIVNEKRQLTIQLYLKSNLTQTFNMKSKIQSLIQARITKLAKNKQISVVCLFKRHTERIGYKAGKLRYQLK